MKPEEIQSLLCCVSSYLSGLEDIDFIDSWRLVKYREEYLDAAPKLLDLLMELQNNDS